MNKKAVVYYRVSTSDQAERGFSLENQKEVCTKYANGNDFDIVRYFSDAGESAKTTDRPGLQEMLKFCANRKNGIGCIIIYKIDRLTRNAEDYYQIKSFFKNLDVQILSATEAISETSSGKFLANIMASVAQLDNDMRSERVKAGMINSVESGRFPHKVTIGYLNFTHPDGKKDIILDPERSELIKYILLEFAKGIYMGEELRKKVNTLGLRTKEGKPINSQLINKILNNKFYCGVLTYHGKEYRGNHPALIDEGVYYKNQQILKRVDRGDSNASTRSGEGFPLRHLVVCGFCGRPLTAGYSIGRHGGRYPYYRCYNRTCGTNKAIAKDKLEEAFSGFLKNITPKKELLDAFKAVIIDVWQGRYNDINKHYETLNKELAGLQQQKTKVLELVKKQLIDDEDFKTEFEKIKEQVASKQSELGQSRLEEFDIDRAVTYVFDFIANLPEFWSRANYWQKLKLVGLIFPEKPVYHMLRFTTPRTSHIFQVNNIKTAPAGGQNDSVFSLVVFAKENLNPIIEEIKRFYYTIKLIEQGMAA